MPEEKSPLSNRGHTYRHVLDQEAAGMTTVDLLSLRFAHSSSQEWADRIDDGEVLINGSQAAAHELLEAGQVLEWVRPPWLEPAVPLDVPVLYEDDDLIAANKPAGLPSLPGAGYLENTLLSVVKKIRPAANPMHRLGRGTSGVVLFACNARAASRVQASWREPGVVRKVYLALVDGTPEENPVRIDTPIGPVSDPVCGTLHSASEAGRASISSYRLLESRGDQSVVEVTIETGRPHQIRIHMAAAGYPLSGDPLYGIGGIRRQGSKARPGDTGYKLHAFRLELAHPESGRLLRLEAAPPVALETFCSPSPGPA